MAHDTKFLTIPEVDRHVYWAAEELARITNEGFVEQMKGTLDSEYGPQLESPLEVIFWIWWKALTEPNGAERYLWLCPQWEVTVAEQTFRLDFGIQLPDAEMSQDLSMAGLRWRPIAVELDGHAFHEKTLEQVTRRNLRDRLLQQAGWTVFHFSWSELTTDPANKVWEVVSVARQQYWALLRDLATWRRQRDSKHGGMTAIDPQAT